MRRRLINRKPLIRLMQGNYVNVGVDICAQN